MVSASSWVLLFFWLHFMYTVWIKRRGTLPLFWLELPQNPFVYSLSSASGGGIEGGWEGLQHVNWLHFACGSVSNNIMCLLHFAPLVKWSPRKNSETFSYEVCALKTKLHLSKVKDLKLLFRRFLFSHCCHSSSNTCCTWILFRAGSRSVLLPDKVVTCFISNILSWKALHLLFYESCSINKVWLIELHTNIVIAFSCCYMCDVAIQPNTLSESWWTRCETRHKFNSTSSWLFLISCCHDRTIKKKEETNDRAAG